MIQTTRRAVIVGAAALPLRARAQTAPVKVGVLLPTSGVLAASGQSSLRGIRYAETILRERGGPAMTIVVADTESKPENGRIGAERLIGEGCSVLIGAWDSGATISAAQAAETARVPIVVNVSSARQITEQGFTQLFRNFPPADVLIGQAVERIKALVTGRSPAPQTAVMLYVNDLYGQSLLAGVDKLWEKLEVPIRIVDRIGYDVRARDLSVEVAKARSSGADLLMPVTRVNDAILIVRELVKQNWSPMAIIAPSGPGPYETAFTKAVGKYGDDYMDCVPWYNPKDKQSMELVNRFERENPEQRFELNVGFSYEALQVVADAITRAGSPDPVAIHAALRTTNIAEHPMYGGPIQFDAKGQNNNIGGVMLQNRNGAPVVVAPADVAMAEVHFPMTPFKDR